MEVQLNIKCKHRGTTLWPSPTVLIKCILIPIILLLCETKEILGEPSKTFHMNELCRTQFASMYRTIDGAELIDVGTKNLDCTVTFQTHSILQRFMLRFETLKLDCTDHLYIYDGAHASGKHSADISCRNTKQSLGTLFTRTNSITLKYVTDGWGNDNNFRLVITAVKDSMKAFCISPDLLCDNINHCEDGSDESPLTAKCPAPIDDKIFGLTTEWIFVAIISVVLLILGCVLSIAICWCRQTANNPAANTNQKSQVQTLEQNGSKHHLNYLRPAVTIISYLHILTQKLTVEIRPYC
ncbi:unnamed protein product [Diamesa serratosioi]